MKFRWIFFILVLSCSNFKKINGEQGKEDLLGSSDVRSIESRFNSFNNESQDTSVAFNFFWRYENLTDKSEEKWNSLLTNSIGNFSEHIISIFPNSKIVSVPVSQIDSATHTEAIPIENCSLCCTLEKLANGSIPEFTKSSSRMEGQMINEETNSLIPHTSPGRSQKVLNVVITSVVTDFDIAGGKENDNDETRVSNHSPHEEGNREKHSCSLQKLCNPDIHLIIAVDERSKHLYCSLKQRVRELNSPNIHIVYVGERNFLSLVADVAKIGNYTTPILIDATSFQCSPNPLDESGEERFVENLPNAVGNDKKNLDIIKGFHDSGIKYCKEDHMYVDSPYYTVKNEDSSNIKYRYFALGIMKHCRAVWRRMYVSNSVQVNTTSDFHHAVELHSRKSFNPFYVRDSFEGPISQKRQDLWSNNKSFTENSLVAKNNHIAENNPITENTPIAENHPITENDFIKGKNPIAESSGENQTILANMDENDNVTSVHESHQTQSRVKIDESPLDHIPRRDDQISLKGGNWSHGMTSTNATNISNGIASAGNHTAIVDPVLKDNVVLNETNLTAIASRKNGVDSKSDTVTWNVTEVGGWVVDTINSDHNSVKLNGLAFVSSSNGKSEIKSNDCIEGSKTTNGHADIWDNEESHDYKVSVNRTQFGNHTNVLDGIDFNKNTTVVLHIRQAFRENTIEKHWNSTKKVLDTDNSNTASIDENKNGSSKDNTTTPERRLNDSSSKKKETILEGFITVAFGNNTWKTINPQNTTNLNENRTVGKAESSITYPSLRQSTVPQNYGDEIIKCSYYDKVLLEQMDSAVTSPKARTKNPSNAYIVINEKTVNDTEKNCSEICLVGSNTTVNTVSRGHEDGHRSNFSQSEKSLEGLVNTNDNARARNCLLECMKNASHQYTNQALPGHARKLVSRISASKSNSDSPDFESVFEQYPELSSNVDIASSAAEPVIIRQDHSKTFIIYPSSVNGNAKRIVPGCCSFRKGNCNYAYQSQSKNVSTESENNINPGSNMEGQAENCTDKDVNLLEDDLFSFFGLRLNWLKLCLFLLCLLGVLFFIVFCIIAIFKICSRHNRAGRVA